MTPSDHAAWTESLRIRLEMDPDVLGFVALGSTARRDIEPDRWSDHDFFVIVRSGAQESFRSDRSWLPRPERIVLWHRETPHGVKALYDDAHLAEFAVFDLDELRVARVNRYRVLLDRGGVEEAVAGVAESTATEAGRTRTDEAWRVAQFLTLLLVGGSRDARGEHLSGGALVRHDALGHLLVLLSRHVPSSRSSLLDDLDAFRRFESVHPELGAEISDALGLETREAARRLVAIARRELGPRIPDFPTRAADVIETALARL